MTEKAIKTKRPEPSLRDIEIDIRFIQKNIGYISTQLEYIIFTIASFHPDPTFRKYAQFKLKEVLDDIKLNPADRKHPEGPDYELSPDMLFLAQMFRELAIKLEKAEPIHPGAV